MFTSSNLIHSYTRTQAIEDGDLIDVTEIGREAGFRVPVALTRSVWTDCVEWSAWTSAVDSDCPDCDARDITVMAWHSLNP